MIIRLDSDYQIIFYPTSFSNFSPFLPHTPASKNRNILITNILRQKIDGGQGGIRTLGTGLRYTHFPGVLIRPL